MRTLSPHSDPFDPLWDVLRCCASLHLLSLSMCSLSTWFHGTNIFTSRVIEVVCCSESCFHKKTKKQTCCTGPCESICIISRFKQLHLSKAMYLNSRVHRFTPSCRLLHSRAITIHSSSRSLCHYEPNCPGLAKSSLCSLLLLLLRNTPELWQMQRLLLAFKTSKIQAAAKRQIVPARPHTYSQVDNLKGYK